MKIALIAGISGLVILFIMSSNIEITEKTIDKITKDNVGDQIKLNGVINKVAEINSTTFIELVQPQKITVVVFKKDERNLSLSYGDYVEVIGKVEEYKDSFEVIAQRIRRVD